jgi:hypothetical protein
VSLTNPIGYLQEKLAKVINKDTLKALKYGLAPQSPDYRCLSTTTTDEKIYISQEKASQIHYACRLQAKTSDKLGSLLYAAVLKDGDMQFPKRVQESFARA